VLDIYDLISKSEPDDVRWEKVKQFKVVLTNGAYPAPPDQVAGRLIEQMLERGGSHLRRRHSKLSSKTDDSSGTGEAGIGGKVKQRYEGRPARASEALQESRWPFDMVVAEQEVELDLLRRLLSFRPTLLPPQPESLPGPLPLYFAWIETAFPATARVRCSSLLEFLSAPS
jgi:hypothetical protein